MSLQADKPTSVSWVIPDLVGGGVGPACKYAAMAVARNPGWKCTVVSLHGSPSDMVDSETGVRFVSLGLTDEFPRRFLEWLCQYRPDILITNDVPWIESAFPYFPSQTLHIIQLHALLKRYRDAAIQNHQWINGVVCVGSTIEAALKNDFARVGFRGKLGTVHNGACFPPLSNQQRRADSIRLLFMGRLDALVKGAFDVLPILTHLRSEGVPFSLTIAGGRNQLLEHKLARKGLLGMVHWAGRVSHSECFGLAASSDVFLMLSRTEAFGMVTIEAMSMGCIPIAYDIPSGNREIIKHEQSGLLLPLGDFKRVALAIRRLHEDRHYLGRLAIGAISRARTDFGEEALGKRVTDFLGQVLAAGTKVCERASGLPPKGNPWARTSQAGYQRVPPAIRAWLRYQVGCRPRLAHWLLQLWPQ